MLFAKLSQIVSISVLSFCQDFCRFLSKISALPDFIFAFCNLCIARFRFPPFSTFSSPGRLSNIDLAKYRAKVFKIFLSQKFQCIVRNAENIVQQIFQSCLLQCNTALKNTKTLITFFFGDEIKSKDAGTRQTNTRENNIFQKIR